MSEAPKSSPSPAKGSPKAGGGKKGKKKAGGAGGGAGAAVDAGGAGAAAGNGAAAAAASGKGGEQQQQKQQKQAAAPAQVPAHVTERLAIWDRIAAVRATELEAKRAAAQAIKVTLPDGAAHDGVQFTTTPYDVAAKISKGLADAAIVALVKYDDAAAVLGASAPVGDIDGGGDDDEVAAGNDGADDDDDEQAGGVLWDMSRPLEGSCKLWFLKFDDARAKHVFWHSSAHVMGAAIEAVYADARLCIGPPLDELGGFYYDAALPAGEAVSEGTHAKLADAARAFAKQKAPFERLELTKAEALDMFAYNKYKLEIIRSKVPDDARCTAYRCGALIDLCRGPHVPHTGRVKAIDVTKTSSAYWLGKAENDGLQRVYGIAFPDAKQLKEWRRLQEEAAKRDHRVVGRAQQLFFFHPLSPGSAFMLPHGARVYNRLMEYIKSEYWRRGYHEVVSPNIFNHELWQTSGHLAHYKDNMFNFKTNEGEDFALKPMNCPGHCLMFAHTARSYKELPLRFADFGVLHRNELSGALSGLTRVRRFQQDDAHIFCRRDQIETEVRGVIEFMEAVYGVFGFDFELELSTRPAKYLGELATWNAAEAAMRSELDAYAARSGKKWRLNKGDGAFYGPKIDVHIHDALRRSFQCATIQLDFQLPLRFKLAYKTSHDDATTAAAAADDGGDGAAS